MKRRSFLGFWGSLFGATAVAAAVTKCAKAESALVAAVSVPPTRPFAVGEIKQFFGHLVPVPVYVHNPGFECAASPSHSHSHTPYWSGSYQAACVVEQKMWDGKDWVPLTPENSARVRAMIGA